MLLRVFRENQTFSVLLVLLLSVLLVALIGVNNSYEPGILSVYSHSSYFLFPWLRSLDDNILVSSSINLFFVLINGFYLSRLTLKHQLLPARNLLPMFIYFFMVLPWFISYRGLSIQLITLPILLFVTDNIFSTAERKNLTLSFFNSSMLLSLASIFYFNIIFYLLFIFFLFFRLRGMYWREFIFIIIGSALPYFFLICILYLTDTNIADYINSIKILWQYKIMANSGNVFVINLIYLSFLFLIASGQAINQYVKMKIITRKLSVSFFIFFIFSLAIVLFIPSITIDGILYVAAPFSFLLGFYFTTCRTNILNQVLFVLFLAGNLLTLLNSYF